MQVRSVILFSSILVWIHVLITSRVLCWILRWARGCCQLCAISAVFFDFFLAVLRLCPPLPLKFPFLFVRDACVIPPCNPSLAAHDFTANKKSTRSKEQRNLVQTYHNFQYCPENLLDLGFIKDRPWLLWSVENCSVILKLLQRKPWIWFRSF